MRVISLCSVIVFLPFLVRAAAHDEQSLRIPIGIGVEKGVVSSATHVTDATRTVVTLLTSANSFSEFDKFVTLHAQVNALAQKVDAQISKAQNIKEQLQRPMADAIATTYGASKAEIAALILLIQPESIWRVDYAYVHDTNELESCWKSRLVCGAMDAARPLAIVQSGFARLDWHRSLNVMSLPEAAQALIYANTAHKLSQRVPTYCAVLVDRKAWEPYFEQKKKEASWWHTVTNFDYGSLVAYIPSWSSKE